MTAAKLFQHSPSQSMAVSIKGSLLTLAILTFISFTYVSLNSLRPSVPSSSPSPVMLPPQGQTGKQQPQLVQRDGIVFGDGGGDEITDLYHSPRVFGLNYEEMERDFKVYIYPDGDPKTAMLPPQGQTGKQQPQLVQRDGIVFGDGGGDEITDLYHSPRVFGLNYEEMERDFKVYIYPDGDPKTFYQTPRKLTGKYASEGYFFQNIRESRFRTQDPDQAHLFFIPISCHKMRGKGTSYENMTIIVQNYVEGLIAKYPYWNRTLGADHFFVTCHDVGVRATEGLPFLIKNAIRVVCSPSYDVGFIPHKDVALPQVLQPFALPSGGNDIENRTVLGFWAGHRNSKIRVILARVWENDTELDISNNRISRATGHLVYQKRFYLTKYCICPGGSQVNSARIADSIHYGCIPVILSNYYDLPFNDILDWQKFSIILKEQDVYQLKQILKSISHDKFVMLHRNLVKVQKHFQWNTPPIKYDAFHMVMYDLWLRRHVIKY